MRTFTVTRIQGHCETTTFTDPGPTYVEVVVSLENGLGESAEMRVPIDEQPKVGDIVEVPDFAVRAPA